MRESLTKQDDYHEYGSYVWALYLSQKHGDSMIKKVWDACEPQAVGAIKALTAEGAWVYASGSQACIGNTAILIPIPTIKKANATSITLLL